MELVYLFVACSGHVGAVAEVIIFITFRLSTRVTSKCRQCTFRHRVYFNNNTSSRHIMQRANLPPFFSFVSSQFYEARNSSPAINFTVNYGNCYRVICSSIFIQAAFRMSSECKSLYGIYATIVMA